MKWMIGTSGWSYRHWVGLFYPEKSSPSQWLSYYSGFFSTAEINATFYRIPFENVVKSWARKTPDHFKFSVKLHRKITHLQKFESESNFIKSFLQSLKPISEKIWFFLIQCPPSLNFTHEKWQQIMATIDRIRESFPKVKIAIEFRHISWFNQEVEESCNQNKISIVYAHSGGRFPEKLCIGEIMYLRLHGPGKLYASKYSDEELKQILGKILNKNHVKEVAIYFNNDYNGYAVENALRLKSMLSEGI